MFALKKILGIIAFIAAATTFSAAMMYKKYLKTGNGKGFCGKLSDENRNWLDTHEHNDVYLISRDNYCLHALMFDNNSDDWVILVHGYDADGTHMTTYARKLYSEGYSILSIDQRGCGLSGDNETTMGHLEKFDVIDWAEKLTREYNAKNIAFLGVSMGAATVMLASSEKMPETVKCIIEDCGYSSVREQFEHSIAKIVHLPPYPMLWICSILTRIQKRWNILKDADCTRSVSDARVPILFIHGDEDDFVPYRMHSVLYNACPRNDKQILTVRNAKHTEAVSVEPELYWNTVLSFIRKYFIK